MNSPAIIVNALLLDLDPLRVRAGEIRVEKGRVSAVGASVTRGQGDVFVDAGGAVVMPGLVNGHTHLYSALATGMPAPPNVPTNFYEILQYVWWRLDRALDLPLCEMSATIGALDAIHCGTTTLIDHHASPNAIDGSLDAIENGLRRVGLRGVLCYEVTDRNGMAGRDAGLRESERYLKRSGGLVTGTPTVSPNPPQPPLGKEGGMPETAPPDCVFAGLVGGHAAFTMSEESLAAVADLARRYSTGVHIHMAEDPCDARICREVYGGALLDRLEGAGILALPSILGHGTHLTPDDLARINASAVTIAHNTRSNMNNAVGYAPLAQVRRPIQLGTDGIGADMFAEVQTAWFKARDSAAKRYQRGMENTDPEPPLPPLGKGGIEWRDGRSQLSPADCLGMLANAARRASQSLGVTVGKLEAGAAADIVVTDYVPATPLTSENAAGHLLFAMGSRQVRHVMVGGQWRLRDRVVVGLDEAKLRSDSRDEAKRLWERMAALPI